MKEVLEKLRSIQNELKAPKGQYNSFGKYYYRSCEDILEAIKPILTKHNCTVYLSDDLVCIGNRNYIKATVTITDNESGESLSNTGFAREDESKKGMDGSQITGTASSYARKYAMNGMFLIDDTKDADTDEYVKTTQQSSQVICPKCGKPVMGGKKSDGTQATPAEVLQKIGMCTACYKAQHEQPV